MLAGVHEEAASTVEAVSYTCLMPKTVDSIPSHSGSTWSEVCLTGAIKDGFQLQ